MSRSISHTEPELASKASTAWGLAALEPPDFAVLHPGAPGARGNAAVIAAGTGLGEAGLCWDGRGHVPFATEGGHSDFAPSDAQQFRLLQYLAARHGRVSWERVVSGAGLVAAYEFLRAEAGAPDEELGPEPAAGVTAQALAGTSPLCAAALDLFTRAYGAEAGNLALKMMATGGLYVAGGIAPKILAKLREGAFVAAFLAKGRMRRLLEDVPVRVVLNDSAGLLGAARCAAVRGGLIA